MESAFAAESADAFDKADAHDPYRYQPFDGYPLPNLSLSASLDAAPEPSSAILLALSLFIFLPVRRVQRWLAVTVSKCRCFPRLSPVLATARRR